MSYVRKTIYYEFWKLTGSSMELKKTGTRVVGENTITTGIDTIPTAVLTIPLEDLPPEVLQDGNVEPNLALYIIKIFYNTEGKNKYTFIGTVDTLEIDYAHYTISMNLSHRVARMREWVMPTGYAVKDARLDYVLGPDGADMGYSSTMGLDTQVYEARVEFIFESEDVANTRIECAFSSVDKLAGLQEALNNTADIHFMVDIYDPEGDRIVIGRFGDLTPVLISPDPVYDDECNDRDKSNYLAMLTEPVYNVDYTSHFNRAVVFCGDVAEGVMHLTLKEIYENPSLQIDGFPVGMYDHEINVQPETEWRPQPSSSESTYNTSKVNNEKVYNNYEIVAYANNDNREYYVTDQQQLEEDIVIKHATYNFSDLYPIPALEKQSEPDADGKTTTIELAITDEDRKEIAKRAYYRAIRILKAQRPEHVWQFNSTPLPVGFKDGQKVTFFFTKKIRVEGDCDNEEKQIARIQKELFVTKRTITFDDELNEINTITLDRELRSRDISAVELELRELAKPESAGGTNNNNNNTQNIVKDNISRRTTITSPRDDWDPTRKTRVI